MISIETKTELLRQIRDEVVALKCPLADERRTNGVFPVIGEGAHDSKIMFIGEAPGKNEALKAKPFCGASGKFLDTLLQSIGLDRQTVYVTNLVKDRPTDNRDPLPEEIALYGKFLERQIEIMQPKVIVTLGRHSMQYIFKLAGIESELLPISKIHGKVFKGLFSYGPVDIIAMYHPAVALYNGSNRQVILDDFQNIKSLLL